MGFHDRNYSGDNWSPRRYGPQRAGRGFANWEVWKKLIAINIAVFLLQVFFTRPATEEDLRRLPYFDSEMYAAYDEESYAEYVREANSRKETNPNEVATHVDGATDVDADTKPPEVEKAEADESVDVSSTSEQTGEETTLKDEQEPRHRTPWAIRERVQEQMRESMFEHMPRISTLQELCELDSEKVKQGELWRLITAGFCHERLAIWHLLFNMLFLYWFGERLERVFGSAEFTAFYFTALLLSSLAYIALDLYTNTNIPAIGASGAVWGVVALYALMYPYERIFIYFLFPIEIRWLVLLYFIFDLHPVLLALSGENQFTGVAHAAHIGGAIFGFLYWNQGWRLMPMIDRLKADVSGWMSKPRESNDSAGVMKMSTADNAADSKNLESDRMDEILEKVSRQGRESLTNQELEFLEETSRKIRDARRAES